MLVYFTDKRVRVSGGPYEFEGRAEYLMDDGTYGTVCDTKFKYIYWPSVYCRQHGYLR